MRLRYRRQPIGPLSAIADGAKSIDTKSLSMVDDTVGAALLLAVSGSKSSSSTDLPPIARPGIKPPAPAPHQIVALPPLSLLLPPPLPIPPSIGARASTGVDLNQDRKHSHGATSTPPSNAHAIASAATDGSRPPSTRTNGSMSSSSGSASSSSGAAGNVGIGSNSKIGSDSKTVGSDSKIGSDFKTVGSDSKISSDSKMGVCSDGKTTIIIDGGGDDANDEDDLAWANRDQDRKVPYIPEIQVYRV